MKIKGKEIEITKANVVEGFVSLGLGLLGNEIALSWFSSGDVLPGWFHFLTVPAFCGISYCLVDLVKNNKDLIKHEIGELFFSFSSDDEKDEVLQAEEDKKHNRKVILDYYKENEGDYEEIIRQMFNGTPGSISCLVSFFNFMDEQHFDKMMEQFNISRKRVVVNMLEAVIMSYFDGEKIDFNTSNVEEILFNLPYNFSRKTVRRIADEFRVECSDIDFIEEEANYEGARSSFNEPSEFYDIFDWQYYESMFKQHVERGHFDEIGTFKYRPEDLMFMSEVFQMMLDMFSDEILFEENKAEEIRDIAFKYAYHAGAYAALNNREYVDRYALLGCLKGWEGVLKHSQKMELCDAVCDQYGYQYHPYKKKGPDEDGKAKIIQFPTGKK